MSPRILLLLAALLAPCVDASGGVCMAAALSRPAAAPLTPAERNVLEKLLPQPTSERPAVRAELRAPLHISCQLQSFPHLPQFVAEVQKHQLPNVEVKEFAQPPHILFFDENQDVVKTVVVAPAWTEFELRDLVVGSLES